MNNFTKSAIVVAAATLSTFTYAIHPTTEKHEFKSSSFDVNFDIERGRGEILLHFQSAAFKDLEQIIVERSSTGLSGFATCKTINVAEVKINGDYYQTADKFPLSAQTDAYYRIKTISKEGITKTFPPLTMAAIQKN